MKETTDRIATVKLLIEAYKFGQKGFLRIFEEFEKDGSIENITSVFFKEVFNNEKNIQLLSGVIDTIMYHVKRMDIERFNYEIKRMNEEQCVIHYKTGLNIKIPENIVFYLNYLFEGMENEIYNNIECEMVRLSDKLFSCFSNDCCVI